MSMGQLAERVGVSSNHMSEVSRGRKNMSPRVQSRVEAALDAPVKVDPPSRTTWTRAPCGTGWTLTASAQNEVARQAGISSGYLSQIMNGQRKPSGDVLGRLHASLFTPSAEERVVPAEVKVMAWKKGGRSGVVVRGTGGPGAGGNNPGGGTVRIGGRVPWGAEVEYAYRAGYDSRGQVSVTHLVDERGYSVMLNRPEPESA